jgi:Zn/Cd-binding protein ZinT
MLTEKLAKKQKIEELKADYIRTESSKKGRIRIDDNMVRFYEGKRTKRYFYLDAGLFEGWFATLILMTIETI